MNFDEPPAGEDEEDDEEVRAENPHYYKCPLGQREWITKTIETAKGSRGGSSSALAQRCRSTFHPPDLDLAPLYVGALTTHVFAPHLTEGTQKPPCPYGCGWDGKVVSNGWAHPGRRVAGTSVDEWLLGPTLKCTDCEKKAAARRARALASKANDSACRGVRFARAAGRPSARVETVGLPTARAEA